VNNKWIALALTLAVPLTAHAGAVVKIDEETSIDFGLRLQTQLVATEKDRDGDGNFESQNDFLIRRARFKARGDIGKWASAFIQSDYEEQAGTSSDMRIIDAYVLLKPHKLAFLYVGQNMSPAIRQEVSSSSAHLALDRPGLAYKSLTWGGRAKYVFTNETYGDSNAKLQGRANVRDLGATLFGNASPTKTIHLKYYLGVYDGVQTAGADQLRFTARAQVNFFEPESSYYNNATYLGKKKTIGIGGSYDTQDGVALDQATGNEADYRLYSIDAFMEMPLPLGSLTAEAGYVNLDLDGGETLAKADGTVLGNASRAQGAGWFAQAGYYVKNFQPWVNYEEWKSDATDDRGSYKAYRAGVTYYLKGHDAKVKAGYEIFEPDVALSPTQDRIKSFVVGLYLDY
jgi:hypothetical protein